jgi:DNA adenine methylase
MGRWFDGGYAQSGYEKTKNGERYRDYYQESKRNILEQTDGLQDVNLSLKDYREYIGTKNALIYCDPPYANTKQYANSTNFDYEEFWNVMRELSKDNIVLISELNAPDDFKCIWEKSVSRTMKSTDNTMRATEKLFTYNI